MGQGPRDPLWIRLHGEALPGGSPRELREEWGDPLPPGLGMEALEPGILCPGKGSSAFSPDLLPEQSNKEQFTKDRHFSMIHCHTR